MSKHVIIQLIINYKENHKEDFFQMTKKKKLLSLLLLSSLGMITSPVFAVQEEQQNGNTSVRTTNAQPNQVTMVLDKYIVGRSLYITGRYNSNKAVFLRAEVNGKKEALVTSKSLFRKKIRYYIGKLKPTDHVEIILFNKNYQEIGRQKLAFEEPIKTEITLNKYIVGTDTEITGTYNGTNAIYMQAEVNGQKKAFVPSPRLVDGKIQYYVGRLQPVDHVELVLFDQNYQEIGRQSVKVTEPAQVKINLADYVIGKSDRILGTYEGPKATYMQAEVNGQKKALVPSVELTNGKINYYVGPLKQTDQVKIVLYDQDYQEIGRQTVPLSVKQEFYILGPAMDGTSGNTERLLITAENQRVSVKAMANALKGVMVPMDNAFGHAPYFTLRITNPDNQMIYSAVFRGDMKVGYDVPLGMVSVPNGSKVVMEHAEGTTRFTTNDNHALRNKLGKTYTYKMEDNRLVLLSVTQ